MGRLPRIAVRDSSRSRTVSPRLSSSHCSALGRLSGLSRAPLCSAGRTANRGCEAPHPISPKCSRRRFRPPSTAPRVSRGHGDGRRRSGQVCPGAPAPLSSCVSAGRRIVLQQRPPPRATRGLFGHPLTVLDSHPHGRYGRRLFGERPRVRRPFVRRPHPGRRVRHPQADLSKHRRPPQGPSGPSDLPPLRPPNRGRRSARIGTSLAPRAPTCIDPHQPASK